MLRNLTTQQVEKIQFDAGIVYIDFGETTERMLAPTRGGGEFTVTNTYRQIERDGAKGPEKGLVILEKQEAALKVTLLSFTQENLAMALPGCEIEMDGSITNGTGGVLNAAAFIKNITMFAKMLDGKYKKIQIYSGLHTGGLNMKAVDKAEGELALDVAAYFDPTNESAKAWRIAEITDPDTAELAVVSVAGSTEGDTLVTVTGKTPGNPMIYKTASTVTLPSVGTDLSADATWLPFTNNIDYTATTGHEFAVCDVSTGKLVVKAAKTTVVSASE